LGEGTFTLDQMFVDFVVVVEKDICV